jgi:hypothetical protein
VPPVSVTELLDVNIASLTLRDPYFGGSKTDRVAAFAVDNIPPHPHAVDNVRCSDQRTRAVTTKFMNFIQFMNVMTAIAFSRAFMLTPSQLWQVSQA